MDEKCPSGIPSENTILLGCKCNFIGGIQFDVMVAGCDSELEGVIAWLDTVQSSLLGLEHTRQLTVDVSVHMFADLAFFHLKLKRHGISLDHLARFWCKDFDTGALSRFER